VPAAKNCLVIPYNTVKSMMSLVLTSKICVICLWILFMDVICLAEERKLVISLSRARVDPFDEETRRALRGTVSKFCTCYLISSLSFKVLKQAMQNNPLC
jgi:hypothetical protein